MPRWTGDWEFINTMHDKHGSCGTETVDAPTKTAAEEAIKLKASSRLFNTTMMQTYILVYNIHV